jgi:hypothetical protein
MTRAIRSTHEIVPIRVIRRADDTYDYVTGLIRLLATEQLGYSEIPAFIEVVEDEEYWLRSALAEQETHAELKTIERGWALARLRRMRAERGLPHRQVDLARETAIDPGDVSTALKVARNIPEDRAEKVAREHGIPLGSIVTLPREPVRMIARARTAEQRDELLNAACTALAKGDKTADAVLKARDALTGQVPEHSRAVTGGRALALAARRLVRWLGLSLGHLIAIARGRRCASR